LKIHIIGDDQESLTSINGFIAYGMSIAEAAHCAPQHVDGILGGGNPGNLVFIGVTRDDLIINLATAREFVPILSIELIKRADRFIQMSDIGRQSIGIPQRKSPLPRPSRTIVSSYLVGSSTGGSLFACQKSGR
jgi:hypothetical protein